MMDSSNSADQHQATKSSLFDDDDFDFFASPAKPAEDAANSVSPATDEKPPAADLFDDLFDFSPRPSASSEAEAGLAPLSSQPDLLIDLGGAADSDTLTASGQVADIMGSTGVEGNSDTCEQKKDMADEFVSINENDLFGYGPIKANSSSGEDIPQIMIDDLFGHCSTESKQEEKEDSWTFVSKAAASEDEVDASNSALSSEKVDSVSSEPEKTKENSRGSSTDLEENLDFSVIQDTGHLDVDVSRHKSSLRKRGSLARRKRPTRSSMRAIIPKSEDSHFQDSTEPKAHVVNGVGSPAEDEDVFDREVSPKPEPPEKPSPTKRSSPGMKTPFVMPGLQELNKSKLFTGSQEKISVVSPKASDSTVSKTGGSDSRDTVDSGAISVKPKPRVLPRLAPKPVSKVQKDTQNLSTAEKKSTPSAGSLLGQPVKTEVEKKESVTTTEDLKLSFSSAKDLSPIEQSQNSINKTGNVAVLSPVGFKPRGMSRSSSTGSESDNKLTDTTSLRKASQGELDSKTTLGKVPQTEGDSTMPVNKVETKKQQPSWLSEMKPRKSVRPSTEDVSKKMLKEEEPEKPSWMKAAMEKKARAAEILKVQGIQNQENNVSQTDEKKSPPWLSDRQLRKTAKPSPLKESSDSGDNINAGPGSGGPGILSLPDKSEVVIDSLQSPTKQEGTATPGSTGKSDYQPSWMKSKPARKLASTNLMSPNVSGAKPVGSNSISPSTGEMPSWKRELVQRNKARRESDIPMTPKKEESSAEQTTPVASWRTQLSQKKKRTPTTLKGDPEIKPSSEPEWKRKAEERRARFMKSGLLEQK